MTELFITFACIGILVGVSVASYRLTTKFLNWIGGIITKISKWIKQRKHLFWVIAEFPKVWYYNRYTLPKLKKQTRENGDEALAAIAERVKEATPRYWKGQRESQR